MVKRNYGAAPNGADTLIGTVKESWKTLKESGYPPMLSFPDSSDTLHIYKKTQSGVMKNFKQRMKDGTIVLMGEKNGMLSRAAYAIISSRKDLERVMRKEDFLSALIFTDPGDIVTTYIKVDSIRMSSD